MSIDPFSFEEGLNQYNEDQFLPYMFGNFSMFKNMKGVNSFAFFDFYIPLIRFHGRRNAINCALGNEKLKTDPLPPRIRGYVGFEREWNDVAEKTLQNMSPYTRCIDGDNLKLLEQFLSECEEMGIRVIFVTTPQFIDGQLLLSNRADLINTIKNVADQYNIQYLDYSNDELCFRKEYFYNSTHLNKYGSNLFMQKLIRDLKITNLLQ